MEHMERSHSSAPTWAADPALVPFWPEQPCPGHTGSGWGHVGSGTAVTQRGPRGLSAFQTTDFCLWIRIFAPRSLKLGLCSLWPDPIKVPLCFLFKLRTLVNSALLGGRPPDEDGHLCLLRGQGAESRVWRGRSGFPPLS